MRIHKLIDSADRRRDGGAQPESVEGPGSRPAFPIEANGRRHGADDLRRAYYSAARDVRPLALARNTWRISLKAECLTRAKTTLNSI